MAEYGGEILCWTPDQPEAREPRDAAGALADRLDVRNGRASTRAIDCPAARLKRCGRSGTRAIVPAVRLVAGFIGNPAVRRVATTVGPVDLSIPPVLLEHAPDVERARGSERRCRAEQVRGDARQVEPRVVLGSANQPSFRPRLQRAIEPEHHRKKRAGGAAHRSRGAQKDDVAVRCRFLFDRVVDDADAAQHEAADH